MRREIISELLVTLHNCILKLTGFFTLYVSFQSAKELQTLFSSFTLFGAFVVNEDSSCSKAIHDLSVGTARIWQNRTQEYSFTYYVARSLGYPK